MGELRQLNEQKKLALWAERVSACRNSGQSVLTWCKEHGICIQTYYKWQKRLYTMVQTQNEGQFVEITPDVKVQDAPPVAVTVHAAGITADIYSRADLATVEAVLSMLKLC